jgi:hypothetical protein
MNTPTRRSLAKRQKPFTAEIAECAERIPLGLCGLGDLSGEMLFDGRQQIRGQRGRSLPLLQDPLQKVIRREAFWSRDGR